MKFSRYSFYFSLLCVLISTESQPISKKFFENNPTEERTLTSLSKKSRFLDDSADYTCPADLRCVIRFTYQELVLVSQPLTIGLEPWTLMNFVIDLRNENNDVEIYYESSQIKPSGTLNAAQNKQKVLIIPDQDSWTMTISKDDLKLYPTLIYVIRNASSYTRRIRIGVFSDIIENGNPSSSILTIVLSIIGAGLLLLLVAGCCYWAHRRRILQAARARAAVNYSRVQHVDDNPILQPNPRPQSLNAILERQSSILNAPVRPPEVNKKKQVEPLTVENLNERFPTKNFESFKSSFPQTTCSICLEDLKEEMLCRQLYCEHIFHADCVKLWLENQLSKNKACCPNCNKSVLKPFKKRANKNKI